MFSFLFLVLWVLNALSSRVGLLFCIFLLLGFILEEQFFLARTIDLQAAVVFVSLLDSVLFPLGSVELHRRSGVRVVFFSFEGVYEVLERCLL